MIKYNTPQELFTAICDKIRDKTNSNELINHQDIPDKIKLIDNNDTILFIDSAIQRKNTICYSFNNTTITKISSRIFSTTNLTTIDLPECTSIGEYAFSNCTNLTTVNLPECTYIGGCAFNGCTNLTTVNLLECTSIGNYAFWDCTHLTTVNLPKCTSIGYAAFSGCTNLATVNLPECTSIGDNVFVSCTNLTTVNLPKCTSIGNYAFDHCTNLTTIDLPECTSIGGHAFESCTNLTTVNLPKCTSIGDYAFYFCTSLTTIILSNNQIVTLEDVRAFNYSSIKNGTGYVYVPDNLVDSYKTATKWSTYANQIKPISELPSNLKEEYGYE